MMNKLFSILVLWLISTMCFAEPQVLQQLHMFNNNMSGVSAPKAPKSAKPINAQSNPQKQKDDVKAQLKVSSNKTSGSPKTANSSVYMPIDETMPTTDKVKTDAQVINEKAFDMVKEKMFPLTSEQVLKLHQEYNESEFALASPVGTPPRPAVTTQNVKLDPGSTPSVVRLGQGFISSVVFLDSTGAPWPIIAYDLGDPTAFNITWDKSGNTLMIQSKKLYTYGNMAIRLQGLNTPLMLTLVPGQKAIDYRVDMRVMGYGPNAKAIPDTVNLPAASNNILMQVLEDVPPPGAKKAKVKGGPAKVWSVGNTMYVRTRLTVLSPGWISMMTSADGMHAYKMSDSPILLVSWHGKVMQLKIEGL